MNLKRLAIVIAFSLAILSAEGFPEGHIEHVVSQQNSETETGKQHGPSANGNPAETGQPLTVPLDISVPAEPRAFRASGKWNLVYELHIANIGNEECTLRQVSVRGLGGKHELLAGLTGKDLEAAIALPGWMRKLPRRLHRQASQSSLCGSVTAAKKFLKLYRTRLR